MLDDKVRAICKNPKLAQQGFFWIERHATKTGEHYQFMAKLERGEVKFIAILNAEVGGICNDVKIIRDSEQCGLSKSMMSVCLRDDKIVGSGGGLNPITSKRWMDKRIAKQAHEVCSLVFFVACLPTKKTSTIVCNEYLHAAEESQFQVMFTGHGRITDDYNTMMVKHAIDEISNSPISFLDAKGHEWFFCRYKFVERLSLDNTNNNKDNNTDLLNTQEENLLLRDSGL